MSMSGDKRRVSMAPGKKGSASGKGGRLRKRDKNIERRSKCTNLIQL